MNKNFEEVYEKIVEENILFLEEARNKAKNNILELSKYRNEFKEKVIKSLVKEIDETFEYKPFSGVSPLDYKNAEFEMFDKFHAEDGITGKLSNGAEIKISDVVTDVKVEEDDGDTIYNKVFSGIFCVIENSKKIEKALYLRKDSNDNELNINPDAKKLPYDNLRIKFDSKEFENKFDIYSEDIEFAKKLLSEDVIDILIDFHNKSGVDYEFTIKDNYIYIRLWSGDMFETAEVEEYSLSKKMIFNYYRILYFVITFSERLKKEYDKIG